MHTTRHLVPSTEFWSWRESAACQGDEDLFYNSEDEPKGVRRRQEEQAVAVCRTCPVIDACRTHALETPELYGVWGGLTENQRHRLSGRHRPG